MALPCEQERDTQPWGDTVKRPAVIVLYTVAGYRYGTNLIGIEILSEEMLVLNMALLLILGGACSLIFKHLRMPVVIGYLIGGIIIAHFGWNTENTMDIVEMLSDIGLVMLMFCIGMELNIGKLKKMGSTAVMTVLIMVPIILIGGILLGQTVLGLNFLQ